MNFRPASTLLPAAALALMVAACGDDPAPAAEEGEREASEEVLEGTISDDMIPLDQMRSQAPLAEPEDEEDGDGGELSDEEDNTESE